MNITQAIDLIVETFFIQQATGERFAIELVSGPGLGKSAGVYQAAIKIARRLGDPCGVKPFFLTTVEPPDVRGFGLPGRDTDGSAIMQFTKAPWMPRKEDPKFGIVFLDEFGQANPDVAKPAAELFHSGRVGESHLPITYMVVAASNRESDRSGVGRSLAFIDNRKMQIQVKPDLDAFLDWGERQGLLVAPDRPLAGLRGQVDEQGGGPPILSGQGLHRVGHTSDDCGDAALGASECVHESRLPLWSEDVQGDHQGHHQGRDDCRFYAVRRPQHVRGEREQRKH